MNSSIVEILNELSEMQKTPYGFTTDQCLKMIEIANAKEISAKLEKIADNLETLEEVLEDVLDDINTFTEAIVRENTGYNGKIYRYACVTTCRD